jgi:kynurenine formamidase
MRIVDLSKLLRPGKEQRRLTLEKFLYPPGEIMHYIHTESHIGTHVEAPSHFIPAMYGTPAQDISQMNLAQFMGEAVFVDLSSTDKMQIIRPGNIETEIRAGDIVLIGNSPHKDSDRPQLSPELIKWLVKRNIRMIGIDDSVRLGPRPPFVPSSLREMVDHVWFLKNEIPIIEQLVNLDRLSKKRFFFAGFPWNVSGLDSSPIRAVAIEDF